MLRSLLAVAVCTVLAVSAKAAEIRGVTDSEIVIGSYTDLSGVTAVWGVNNNNAWRMMFDAVNEAGGINGRKIKFITEDNQYQVPRSVQAANKLINRDNVFIMVANDGTPMNNAVMPDQLAKNVPNMFPLTSARSMYYPFHHLKFGLAASYYDMMRAGVKLFIEQRGKQRICAMSQDSDFGRDVMDGARDQLKAMNVALTAETLHKSTDTDFSASVAKLRDANCDLVLLGSIVRDTIQIVSAIRKSGWNVDLLGQVAVYDQAVAEAPGGATEGLYAMTSILYADPGDPRPAVQDFVKKYKARFGHDPNFAAQVGIMGAELVIEGLRNAGRNLTVESFITAMEQIKNHQDIFGSPPMTFGPDKHQGSNESFLTVVKAGRWVPVDARPVGY
ncbi:MAG: ABC transporter substrate-binding protein [Rhodospirillales bacterium]|nr:ABC transporter substrate-binding protein [Rhodospirillales bacterium]